jgi:hypothetical protein
MPLTLTLTEGVLPLGKEKDAIALITEAMLKWHGLTGNPVMKRNVTATVHVLKKGTTFSGGEAFCGAWIEWKVPSFAFTDRAVQQGFSADVTSIIQDLSGGKQPQDHIYVNVVHAVDGIWNFDGIPLTNEQIIEKVQQG